MKKVVVLLLSLTAVLFAAGGCALPGTAAKSVDRRTEHVSDNMKLRMRRTYRIMARSVSRNSSAGKGCSCSTFVRPGNIASTILSGRTDA